MAFQAPFWNALTSWSRTLASSSLRVDNVTVKYGDFIALQNVSIDVKAGQITTVIGANGAGKSTLLKAISGLQRIAAGSIQLDSTELHKIPRHRITRLGVVQVPEARGIFPDMTVEENLYLAALYKRRSWTTRGAKDALAPAFEQFPVLYDKRSAHAATLSGGQQQMLSLARSFLLEPKVLLADELSFGLAPVVTEVVFQHVAELNAKFGTTVLMVEQNVGRALEMCSYVYVLRTGRVVHEGAPDALLEDREHLFEHMIG